MLAAVGLSDDAALARRKRVKAEACIPSGKKCPAKKPRGKKKKKLGCEKCCQGFVVPSPSGKQKCSCKPNGQPCNAEGASQCCSGVCDGGVCQSGTPTPRPSINFAVCTTPNSSVAFVTAPDTPPEGSGAAKFTIGADGTNEFAHLRTPDFAGKRLDDLDILQYATYVETVVNCGPSGQAPYLILRINFTGGSSVDDIILFEPIYSTDTIACQEWQTWDAAHPNARWWSVMDPNAFFTLSEYLAAHPDATLVNAATSECPGVLGGLRIAAGEGVPWSNSITFVNFIRVRFDGESAKEVVF